MKKGVDYIGVSAGAVIINDKGEILLCKRSQLARNEKGSWEAPGGSVEFGELRTDAVKREIKEELGVDVEIIDLLHVADEIIVKDKQHWVATSFVVKIKRGQTPMIMEPEKCDAIGWFGLDKLPRPLSLITKLDLKEYKKRYSSKGI